MGTYLVTWQADEWLQCYELEKPVFQHLRRNWIGGDGCAEKNIFQWCRNQCQDIVRKS